MKNQRPAPTEYNEYYKGYIDKATGVSVIASLEQGQIITSNFFDNIPKDKQHYRYQERKWTPKEVLLHLIDTERVFTYRALQFARASQVTLQGFDQIEFADNAQANARRMEDLIAEYNAVRNATIQFAKSCSDETLVRMGIASNSPLSVRAALYIIVGHEIHHCAVVKEKYLKH